MEHTTTPATEVEPEVEGFASDGISRLIAVTQMKSNDANEEALQAAPAPTLGGTGLLLPAVQRRSVRARF